MSTIKDVFEPAGMTVALLGEKRNVVLSHGLAPAGAAEKLPSWGFCVAVHTGPPIVRAAEELARVVVGADAAGDACGKTVQAAAAPSCVGGLLETLGGLDAPPVKSEFETPYY